MGIVATRCGGARYRLPHRAHRARLGALVGTITATDVSPGMIQEARRRCGDLARVVFKRCNGRDLADFRDGSFDLVLAGDSFPYLFAADPAIVAQHLRDCAPRRRSGKC
jgi:ubiquinone/menaquinone biosynthesis C-methylase UbiE